MAQQEYKFNVRFFRLWPLRVWICKIDTGWYLLYADRNGNGVLV